MKSKLPPYQITDMLKADRLNTKNLVFYYQKSSDFSFQIIFSAKPKLKVVEKSKIKRQLRQETGNLKFQELNLNLLILVKKQAKDLQSLRDQLIKARQQLSTIK